MAIFRRMLSLYALPSLIAAKNIRKERPANRRASHVVAPRGETSAVIIFILVIAVLALLVYLVMSNYKLPF